MLLNLLSKEEKYYFLDLLMKVNSIDGELNDFEKMAIERFKSEMGDDISRYRKSNLSSDKLIEYFAQKSKQIKNIVYYNIIWASLSDEFYSVEEHLLLDQIVHAFGITNKKRIELQKAVYADRDLREKVKRIVFEW